jgi:REP element-mobilizing transposase RayT
MPRPPRPQLAGGVYHVTSRGVRGSAIFISDADRELFTALLRRVARRRHWHVFLYCLMSNHFHLVVETPEPDLSRGIQYLKGVYAQAFNEIHGFTGALYERRFWCGLIESDEALTAVCEYVVANPVTAGLCDRPVDWWWTGGTFAPRLLEPEAARRAA